MSNDWDILRAKNEQHMARPRFQWTPQRKHVLQLRAANLETGAGFFFAEFSTEWARRQLASMRRHMQVATDEQLIAVAREEGIIPND